MPVSGLSLLGHKRIRGLVSILRYINSTIIIIIIISSNDYIKDSITFVNDIEYFYVGDFPQVCEYQEIFVYNPYNYNLNQNLTSVL